MSSDEPTVAGSASPGDRFRRQIQFPPLGVDGQRRLAASRVAILGVGALGTHAAELLTRAGVGYLRLIDRDWVEWDNLPRQCLFVEEDARQLTPKVVAAARELSRIDPNVQVDPQVVDFVPAGASDLLAGVDLVIDATDNFEARLLLNDVCLEQGTPWVHGGCLAASGQVMFFEPGQTVCFRCMVPDLPPAAGMQTCDTAGVLGPAVALIAARQALEAIKWLSGNRQAVLRQLLSFDLWTNQIHQIDLDRAKLSPDCPACTGGLRDFLTGHRGSQTLVLCGRQAVQIQPPDLTRIDLGQLAERLRPLGEIRLNPFLLRLSQQNHSLTLFPDGRAIVGGTEDPTLARTLYARWVGS